MSEVVNGRNIILYKYDYYLGVDIPFAYSTECDLTIQTSTQEVTDITSANYRKFKPDMISWGMSVGGFIILDDTYNYMEILQAIADRETFLAKWVVDNDGLGLAIISGQCMFTSLVLNGPDGQPGTYKAVMQGTGAFSTAGAIVTPGGIVISGTTVSVGTYTSVLGGETVITPTPSAVGKTCLYLSRGGTTVESIATAGSPSANGAVWNTATGVFTVDPESVPGERFRALFL